MCVTSIPAFTLARSSWFPECRFRIQNLRSSRVTHAHTSFASRMSHPGFVQKRLLLRIVQYFDKPSLHRRVIPDALTSHGAQLYYEHRSASGTAASFHPAIPAVKGQLCHLAI